MDEEMAGLALVAGQLGWANKQLKDQLQAALARNAELEARIAKLEAGDD